MLKIEGLKKNYDGFSLDASLQVPDGIITGLIGRNGSGKSTIFKSILGLIKKDGGNIYYNGKEISQITGEDKEEFGIALTDSIFSVHLTINQVKRVIKGLYKSFDEALFDKMATQMKLPLNKKIKEFSTGMQAKTKLLLATTHKSKFLLLDEPTSGLDVIAREEVLDFIREYMEDNEDASVIISSHIASDLEGLCDDIYLIEDGKIIFYEETDVLLSNYGLIKIKEEEFDDLDKNFILKYKKEPFGYKLLTNEKQYYMDNFPKLVIEKANIDELITIMDKGEDLWDHFY